MAGEQDLSLMLKNMQPHLQQGAYVFCSVKESIPDLLEKAIGTFKEKEGLTLILEKELADAHQLSYDFIAAWIRLDIHSALDAVGLTAAFSNALGKAHISCNVIAAYYHDHIFVAEKDAQAAMRVLKTLSENSQ